VRGGRWRDGATSRVGLTAGGGCARIRQKVIQIRLAWPRLRITVEVGTRKPAAVDATARHQGCSPPRGQPPRRSLPRSRGNNRRNGRGRAERKRLARTFLDGCSVNATIRVFRRDGLFGSTARAVLAAPGSGLVELPAHQGFGLDLGKDHTQICRNSACGRPQVW